MSEKPASTPNLAANLYLVAAVAFLFAGVVFLITGTTGMWISFFALGTVFMVLSATERAKTAKAASSDEPQPDDPQG